MITIGERIDIPVPPDVVWEVLSDPEAVISCIGGAELGESHADGSFDATLAIKFGGLRVAFKAQAMLELEDQEMVGRLSAHGADRQGATRVSSETTFRVEGNEQGHGSVITLDGEVELNGTLASVIDAGAGVVVGRMTREFAASLAARCAGDVRAHVTAASREDSASVAPGAPDVRPGARGWLTRLRGSLVGILRPSARAARTAARSAEQAGSPVPPGGH